MAETKRARRQEKDLLTRLADVGEDAVHRVAELPGGKTLLETANALRERLDELAARIRSIDPLERRVAALEKRLSALEQGRSTSRQTAARRSRPARRPPPDAA